MSQLARFYCVLVFLTFSLNVYSQAKEQESLTQLYKRLHTSVVVLKLVSSVNKEERSSAGNFSVTTVKSKEVGSGLLIENNLVLTAAHVVHGSDKLKAVFFDGIEIMGKVISSDISADLSLVRLDKPYSSFKPIIMGDSDKMEIGDPVFVIGAPYNVSYTLSRGIISGRHHAGYDSDFSKSEFFQTDASLNPGNSGGPMFNMQGEVIGIASFIKTQSGGSEGLGFAVTMNSAKKNMLNQPRFYSGITHHLVEGGLARALNIPQEGGLLVQHVVKDSLTGRLGLKGGMIKIKYHKKSLLIGGDIILKIDDIPINSQENYDKINKNLLDLGANKEHSFTILRNGEIRTLTWQ